MHRAQISPKDGMFVRTFIAYIKTTAYKQQKILVDGLRPVQVRLWTGRVIVMC